ncbi:MAG: hypothetical protein GVY22_02260 [Gammaproteobacteria bacterium]|nr:hypothetical protein [Gammaproteobacteria bacterium]
MPDSREAERELLAIAGQESSWTWRYQLKPGGPSADGAYPARGFWQFERRGGVAGVLRHQRTAKRARALCEACHVYPDSDDVWRALEGHDLLATGFARLLLWTEPDPLPKTRTQGWKQYLDLWRPGRPYPDKWAGYWKSADDVVR